MTDINPEIFNNPNLGINNHLPYLHEIEAQKFEDHQATAEGREPEKLKFDRFGVYGESNEIDELEALMNFPRQGTGDEE